MGVAFLVPLLDRHAAKGKPSPLFTDLGVAGILFVGFLTLKAWDIGVTVPKGQDPAADPALAAAIARTAAIWIIGLGLAATRPPHAPLPAQTVRLHGGRPPAGRL